MKFTLTITDATEAEIRAFLNKAPSGSNVTVQQPGSPAVPAMPTTTAIPPSQLNDDDDDNGPENTNAPERDTNGIPWDERIHASSKALTDKGVWRKKRGVSDSYYAEVEAELKAAATQPAPAIPAMPEQPAAPAPSMPAMPEQPPVAAPAMPQMPAMPEQPAAPAPQQQTLDFNGFMMHLGSKMGALGADGNPIITPDYLAKITGELATAFNRPMNAITDLSTNPDMIRYAVQLLQRDQKW